MTLEQLQALIDTQESKTVELKKSTATIQSAFATICAFLNGKGGTVLIGVMRTVKLWGKRLPISTRREIANEIKKLEPTPHIGVDYIKIKEINL